MNEFIDSNFQLIPEKEEEAYKYLKNEEKIMTKLYETAIKFVKNKDLVIKKPNKHKYFEPLFIYTNNLIVNSFLLTNELAKETKYISMTTEIPYKLIYIRYARKVIIKLHKHIMIKNNPCLKTCSLYHFDHGAGLAYVPPEYYMINKYQELYSNEITQADIEEEKIEANNIVKKMDNYISNISSKIHNYNDKEIEKALKSLDDDFKDTNIMNLQKEMLNFIKKNYIVCGRTILKIRNLVPNILYLYFIGDANTGREIFNHFKSKNRILTVQLEFILLMDSLIRTLWVMDKKSNNYVAHFSNSLDYEIIPYKMEKGFRVAHPYVSKRLLLIELPYLIYSSNLNDAEVLLMTKRSLERIRKTFVLLGKENLSSYNKYMGKFKDPTIVKKLEQNKVRQTNPGIVAPYDPTMYKLIHKEYKEVSDVKEATCN